MDLKRPIVLLAVVGSLVACGDDTQGPIERWSGDRDTVEDNGGGTGQGSLEHPEE